MGATSAALNSSPMPQEPQSPESADFPHRYTARLADEIERAWQSRWAKAGVFRAPNPGEPGFDPSRPKFYCLDMFPYPSGAGLHVGHPEGYTATDIVSRYMRMCGYAVLHPMGWDAFGLPAEQYAIQTGVHPAVTTRASIDNFRRQLQRFGFSYDWSREFGTIDETYYRWTQWIFLRLYESWFDPDANAARPVADLVAALECGRRAAEPLGAPRAWPDLSAEERRDFIDGKRLAYLSEQMVNWCPKLGTVLANDEVIDGKSERGGHPVLRKPMRQWTFRITAYAERLLSQLEGLDWPSSTKAIQSEWIGRSDGAEIDFALEPGLGIDSLRVFTTRPDTLFGATYMVVAPEHALIDRLLGASPPPDLASYVRAARNRSDVERQESREKTGVFTGAFAINPATGRRIPIWTADYVLAGYGTGAIMAVPAHDERDFEFAKKFALPIEQVVLPPAGNTDRCFSGDGTAVNSANAEVSLDKLPSAEAKERIIHWLERTKRGKRKVNFKLRDWTFSRQRYWGEPFPIVYTDDGRPWPVADRALPVTLPELADYAPVESEDPQPLLAKAKDWVRTTAGAAGVDPALLAPETPVSRETNTMPGSAGSSWYFLRYCDPRNSSAFASDAAMRCWLGSAPKDSAGKHIISGPGVDLYIGGPEHAVGHLLYARFWTNVLFDLGLCPVREPFRRLFHQGMITSFAYQRPDKSLVPADEAEETADGAFVERGRGTPLTQIIAKMSKSLKNVVNPDDVIAQYGADTFRLYEMYMGPLEAGKPWNPRDIVGCFRFLQRVWRNFIDERTGLSRTGDAPADPATLRLLHKTIRGVRRDIESLGLNTAISKLIEFNNHLATLAAVPREVARHFLLLLSPFAPHIADELARRVLDAAAEPASLAAEPFPECNEALAADDLVEIPVQVQGKVRGHVHVAPDAPPAEIEAAALAEPRVAEFLAGRPVKRIVVVPRKMVNIVV